MLHFFFLLFTAMLFPPKNLTVGLLDFNATAEWLPGQGNPPGTKYTLEYTTVQNMYLTSTLLIYSQKNAFQPIVK